MTNDKTLIQNVRAAYVSLAAYVENIARWLFTATERILMVGAVQYAASALPEGAALKGRIEVAADLLQAFLVISLMTSIYAVLAADFETLSKPTWKASTWMRKIFLAVLAGAFLGGGWWLNHEVSTVTNGIVRLLSTKLGH